jgi:hypothetical protein
MRAVHVLQVADYWRMVIDINDYQKQRYVERVINGMFNTVSNKKIAVRSMQHNWTATNHTFFADTCVMLRQTKLVLTSSRHIALGMRCACAVIGIQC